jgi:hypothetical protein
MAEPDVIIAFSSGCCSKDIATTVDLLYSIWGKLVIIQSEVAEHLKISLDNILPLSNLINPGKPLSIKKFFSVAIHICKASNRRNIIIVADEYDYNRCEKKVKKEGLSVIPLSEELSRFSHFPKAIYCNRRKFYRWFLNPGYIYQKTCKMFGHFIKKLIV